MKAMGEEMQKPQEITTEEVKVEEVKAEEARAEEVKTEEIKPEEVRKSTPENDLSNIKIRHVLGQRIKKYGVRKIISYLLVAVIFFCGGFLTDRFIIRHRIGRGFYGKPGIQRGIPGNPFGQGRGGKFNKGQQPPSNNPPSQNQTQGSQPADGQEQ